LGGPAGAASPEASPAIRAANSWRKARAHLAELEGQDPVKAPMAVIHSAYYAMFHAARAVLFQATGAAPRRHDRVISAFGQLVRDGDASLRRCGRWLNEVKDDRVDADYNEELDPAVADAEEAAKLARDFLAVCRASFALGGGEPPLD
jgi:uncharacterized protein (UPF0332 family)